MPQSPTDDRIRLALVITELEPGGAERCLTNLAVGLDRNRFAPVVYSLAPRPSAERGQLVEQLEAAGVPVRFIGVKSKLQFFAARRNLARLLAEQSPQIVQSFLYHANVVATLAAKRAGVARVVTNIRVADPSRLRQRVERFVTRRVSKVVCVSESVARYAREQLSMNENRLAVIPNGIIVAHYPAGQSADLRQFRIAPERKVLVCIGRLDRQKGIDWLLGFAPLLLKELPGHDLLLVGDGPQRAELESLSQSLSVAQRVHFAGWQPNVPEILRACELLVLPSRWEGMPNVLLEAMCSGLPVVATQVEGVTEVLGPPAVEQSVTANDASEFLIRILAIARDANLAKNLGAQNRERVERHYSLAAMIGAYERLYESLFISPLS